MIDSKAVRVLLVIAVIGGVVGWEFGIKASREKAQQYEGTIVEKYRKRDWLRGLRGFGEPEYRFYNHYLRIRTDDDSVVTVRVPNSTYTRMSAGDPVEKFPGDRYPKLMTDDAIRSREVMGDLF